MSIVFKLPEKIKSSNASEFEKQLNDRLDASDMTYISSAGLRVLLRLVQKCGDVVMKEVPPDVESLS